MEHTGSALLPSLATLPAPPGPTVEERVAAVLGLPVPLPPTLTVDQVARCYGLSRGLAFQGCRDGSIPSVRVGRRVLCPTAKLLALLGRNGDRLADVRARVARFNEALSDGETGLAQQIGLELEADLSAEDRE